MIKLLPCPFCGSTNIFRAHNLESRCADCDTRGPNPRKNTSGLSNEEFRAALWNKRAVDSQDSASEARVVELEAELARLRTLRPRDTYHDDDGPVLWWRVPVVEPPYAGWPSEDDFPEDYFTHWTPIPNPEDLDE